MAHYKIDFQDPKTFQVTAVYFRKINEVIHAKTTSLPTHALGIDSYYEITVKGTIKSSAFGLAQQPSFSLDRTGTQYSAKFAAPAPNIQKLKVLASLLNQSAPIHLDMYADAIDQLYDEVENSIDENMRPGLGMEENTQLRQSLFIKALGNNASDKAHNWLSGQIGENLRELAGRFPSLVDYADESRKNSKSVDQFSKIARERTHLPRDYVENIILPALDRAAYGINVEDPRRSENNVRIHSPKFSNYNNLEPIIEQRYLDNELPLFNERNVADFV
jgi:hypothetical protein